MRRSDGTETAKVSSDYTGGGLLQLWNDAGQLTVHLVANSGTESGVLTIGNDLGQPSIYMRARESGTQGGWRRSSRRWRSG
jgi:hypothetical protein